MIHATSLHLIAFPVYIVILVSGIKKRISLQKHIIIFLFFVYLIGVLSVTLFPLPVQKELIIDRRELYYIQNNIVPFRTIIGIIAGGSITIIRTLIANIILFIPLGSLLPLLFKKVSIISIVVFWGLVGSIGIESLQYIISSILGFTYRSTDIDDIILNTIGAGIGFIMIKISLPITGKFIDVSHLERTDKESKEHCIN